MFRHRSVLQPLTIILVTTLLVGGLDAPAQAFANKECAETGDPQVVEDKQISYEASDVSFPFGHVDRGALDRARTRWNRAPGDFEFLASTYVGDPARDNGEDEIWFTNSESLLSGFPGRSITVRDCESGITESDVVFKASLPWSFTSDRANKIAYFGSSLDWNTIALHEMGHSQGLSHVNVEYNIMGSDQYHTHANGDRVEANVGEDAGDGQVFLYGKGPGIVEDLGVSHWKYSGPSGEYSAHERTKLYRSSDGKFPSSTIPFDGVRRYNVDRGSNYDVEFTYENNGFSYQSNVKLGFYVSTNNTVTTADRLVGTGSINLAVDDVVTLRTPLKIPNDLLKGQTYWLGVVIDPDDVIAENDTFNGTFMPILIN